MDQVCSSIIQAFAVIQSPYSSSTERQHASQAIEDLKQRIECATYMLHILQQPGQLTTNPQESESIRFMSLKVLEDCMVACWNSSTAEVQSEMRLAVLDLVQNKTHLYAENKSIRTKLAKMVAEVAKRHYPSYWPSFIHDLVGMWSQGIPQKTEICLQVIEFVVEDCVDSDFNSTLPTQRRTDIITSLKDNLKPLLEYTFGYLGSNVTDLYQALSVQGSIAGREQQCELIRATLKMLCPIATVATAEEFSAEGANFAIFVPNLLDIGPIQDQAVKFLSLLISRKLYVEVFLHFLGALPAKIVSSLQVYSSLDREGSFAFSRTLASSLCSMIATNLHLFTEQRLLSQTQLEPALSEYFSALVKVMEHPSRRLSSDAIKDITKIFRDDVFIGLYSWMGEVASHIVGIFAKRTVKVLWDEEEAPASTSPFGQGQILTTTEDEDALIEFDNKDEYMDHFGSFRSNIRVFVGIFGSKFPIQCITFLGQKLLSVKAQHSAPATSDRLNAYGGCSYSSSSILEWDTMVVLLDAGIKAIVDSFVENAQTQGNASEPAVVGAILAQQLSLPAGLSDITEIILSLAGNTESSISDAIILLQVIRSLKSMTPFLKLSPTQLIQVFVTLFEKMNYGDSITPSHFAQSGSSVAFAVFQENAGQVRKMAGTVIAHLSALCAETLVATNSVEQLCTHALGVLSVVTDSTQKTSMLEALIALSEKIPDAARKREMYFQLLGEIVGTLTSANTLSLFSSPSSFIMALETAEGRIAFDRCVEALSTVVSVSRRVGFPKLPKEIWTNGVTFSLADVVSIFPYAEVLSAILPSINQILAVLHGLWDHSIRLPLLYQTLPQGLVIQSNSLFTTLPMLSTLYDMVPIVSDKAGSPKMSCCRLLSDIEAEHASGSPAIDANLGTVAYHLRYQIYQLLGLAAGHKVLYLDEAHDLICQTLMQTSSLVDNSHMGQLIKYFIEPYSLNIFPAIHARSAFFLSSIFYGLLDRLSYMWSSEHEGAADIATLLTSTSSAQEREHHLKIFIFKYCGLRGSIYVSSTEELEAYRQSVISSMSKHYADTLMSILCCRGFLSLPLLELKKLNKKTLSGTEQEEFVTDTLEIDEEGGNVKDNFSVDAEQLEARRSGLLSFVLANEGLRAPFLCSVIAMLSVPDSNCSKKALTMLEQLVPMSLSCAELYVPIGRECFLAVLGILLRQEPWSRGLEWSYIGLIEQIYSLFVPESSVNIESRQQQPHKHARLPREALLHIGMPLVAVENLELRLCEVQNKKRRRDTLRDFFVEMSSSTGSGKLQVGDSSGSSVTILDIPPIHKRLSASALRRQVAAAAQSEVLSSSDIISSMFS